MLWCGVMWCILHNGWVTPVQSVMSDALCGSSASIHARRLQFFHALVSWCWGLAIVHKGDWSSQACCSSNLPLVTGRLPHHVIGQEVFPHVCEISTGILVDGDIQ